MPSPTEITVAQLSRLIGTAAAPQIIDLRIEDDFAMDPNAIPTALRHSFTELTALMTKLQGVAIFFLALPFPLIIGLAAIFGFLRARREPDPAAAIELKVSASRSLLTIVTWLLKGCTGVYRGFCC